MPPSETIHRLRLKSLDVSGFKSFVDPVGVEFAGGITAIVGPNGCGKSNLADAVTWVLGEQSAKSLRAKKMEDVIFNGTGGRKPVGMADVTLTFATDPGSPHSIDGETRISRRVFRPGPSQYRLNGKVVRLKEIRDLLMDTGLGIRAYSVIEQGRIGMVLSGKPQERRKLLEEAAGITRYKQHKRLAELKLEEATANLLRLDDVISEVDRALRSLKRQASAARRYQVKQGEYRDLLKQVLLGRWSLVRDRLGALEDELAELTGRDAALTADLHRGEADLARGRENLDALSSALAERHQHQADLAAAIEGRQEFLKGARQRSMETVERLERGRSRADDRRGQIDGQEHALGDLEERRRELLEERDAAAHRVADDDAEIARAEEAVAAATERLEEIRQQLLASIARVNGARSSLQQEHLEIEKRSYRRDFLDEEKERLDRQRQGSHSALESIEEKLRGLENELEDRIARRDELKAELDGLLAEEASLGDEQRRLESLRSNLEQRRRFLIELSEEHAERRRALADELAGIGVGAPRFLADLFTPPEGWEETVDAFLGNLSEAVILDPGDDGLELARRLSGLGASGVFLRPLAAAEVPRIPDAQPLAESLGLPPELAAALPPAYLVPSDEDAVQRAAENPGAAFLSRDRLWAQGGALSMLGAEAATGVLARESELDSIREEIAATEGQIDDTIATLRQRVGERTRCAAEVNRLGDEITGLQRETAVAQARRQDLVGRERKLTDERTTVVEEEEEIVRELDSRSVHEEELTDELTAAEAEHDELSHRFDRAQVAVEETKEDREALRTTGAGRRGRLDLLEERLEAQNQEADRIHRQRAEAEEQIAAWNEEEEQLELRLVDLDESMDAAEKELQDLLEGRAEAQDGVLQQQELLDGRREELRALEQRLQSLRAEGEDLRSQIEERRVDQAGLRHDAEHLGVTYGEEFKRTLPGFGRFRPAGIMAAGTEEGPGAIAETAAAEEREGALSEAPEARAADENGVAEDAETEAADSEDELDAAAEALEEEILEEDDVEVPEMDRGRLAELEAELARVKAIMERLGPVNVLAAQEFEEQKERRKFLGTQRKDVASSVESLRDTIREINETSSVRFKETFAVVNKKFGEMFAKLFRGGEAEMRLFDEEDLLESGIEIVARPPGKRFQNITLLSGGEKALTAVALLFALFQTKPSPFCILDEVDAPLDDVNVLRFVDTLKDLAEDTQFLIITHNKLTMEVAATLYGVTMEERGVSKLVSVEIDHVQPQEEAASA